MFGSFLYMNIRRENKIIQSKYVIEERWVKYICLEVLVLRRSEKRGGYEEDRRVLEGCEEGCKVIEIRKVKFQELYYNCCVVLGGKLDCLVQWLVENEEGEIDWIRI